MEIYYKNIRLFLNLKKHYQEEVQISKNVIINIRLKVNDNCLKAKKLEETFDYVVFERLLIQDLEDKQFELLEEVINRIFQLGEGYKFIDEMEVEIIKKNVLQFAEEVSLRAFRQINKHL